MAPAALGMISVDGFASMFPPFTSEAGLNKTPKIGRFKKRTGRKPGTIHCLLVSKPESGHEEDVVDVLSGSHTPDMRRFYIRCGKMIFLFCDTCVSS